MWPYVAGAIVALGGLWKLVAILRCRQEDVPKVAGALSSMITLRLPRCKRTSEPSEDSALDPSQPRSQQLRPQGHSEMAKNLDPSISIAARVDGFVVIAVIPHATMPLTWAVVGRRDATIHATWTATAAAPGDVPRILDRTDGFCRVEDALAEMLRRARS
jgi:hypothetical protein